jgi:hypothetical protein
MIPLFDSTWKNLAEVKQDRRIYENQIAEETKGKSKQPLKRHGR